jgi:hypothetical protein
MEGNSVGRKDREGPVFLLSRLSVGRGRWGRGTAPDPKNLRSCLPARPVALRNLGLGDLERGGVADEADVLVDGVQRLGRA